MRLHKIKNLAKANKNGVIILNIETSNQHH